MGEERDGLMPEPPDFEKVIIPAKAGHRIVIEASGASFYESVETGERIPTGVQLSAGMPLRLGPEPPDFEQMARRMIDLVKVLSVEEIAAQLRLVWNARGAADLAALEPAVGMFPSVAMDDAIEAIHRLDRDIERGRRNPSLTATNNARSIVS
jgi:hypothetical protein